MSIATLLDNLITKKYYAEKSDIQRKLDVFYAMSKISDEEYTTLTLKAEDTYKIENVEETVNAEDTADKVNDSIESEK